MAYKIEWEEKGTFLEFSGKLSIQEIHSANGELHSDARISNQTYSIWNLLNADLSSITKKEVLEPAAMDFGSSHYIPTMKIAFIAREAYTIELIHCYIDCCRKLNIPWEYSIFDDANRAIRWASA